MWWFGQSTSAAKGVKNAILNMDPDEAVALYNSDAANGAPPAIYQAIEQIIVDHLIRRDIDSAMEFVLTGGSLEDATTSSDTARIDGAIIGAAQFESGAGYVEELLVNASPERSVVAVQSFALWHVRGEQPEAVFSWIDGLEFPDEKVDEQKSKLKSSAFATWAQKDRAAAKEYAEGLEESEFSRQAFRWLKTFDVIDSDPTR